MGLIHPLGIFNGVSTALQGMDLARGHQHYKILLSSIGISPKPYWDVSLWYINALVLFDDSDLVVVCMLFCQMNAYCQAFSQGSCKSPSFPNI